mmetsp:Transcript_34556/g.88007  ORF Transcript_34556/g.88007 Transcript_34556/m.88007 type:complete len:158 (+) Transcript_34556:140-613(+)|eukprot:CAMPEP_0183432760 /NCGR_PEP_ID=MMETSP0370-20130417/59413_1 /TAXON_ID=268820 /ORGANISM="Peridinium aciculiferum, Strain PAER-2" /LENGTH=157 /DNA_ID=CAMNT_0025618867 /DNA_START=47 /DNA_END=520 /DNA_ORIENTATION=-
MSDRRRSRSRERRQKRDEQPPPEDVSTYEPLHAKQRPEAEQRRMDEEEAAERRKLADDAARMDRTVMLVGLNCKADERDVFEFFVGTAGKVRDVQIIRDSRTGRSKGVAYVEFASAEGTIKAMRMSGQVMKGATIRVQPSQSDGGRTTFASQTFRNA